MIFMFIGSNIPGYLVWVYARYELSYRKCKPLKSINLLDIIITSCFFLHIRLDHLGFSSMGRNDESTLFFDGSNL